MTGRLLLPPTTCVSCDRPEGACEGQFAATGYRCCDSCDHDPPVLDGLAPGSVPPTGHVDPEHYRARGHCRQPCRRCRVPESRGVS
jgi:hypothetical protein